MGSGLAAGRGAGWNIRSGVPGASRAAAKPAAQLFSAWFLVWSMPDRCPASGSGRVVQIQRAALRRLSIGQGAPHQLVIARPKRRNVSGVLGHAGSFSGRLSVSLAFPMPEGKSREGISQNLPGLQFTGRNQIGSSVARKVLCLVLPPAAVCT